MIDTYFFHYLIWSFGRSRNALIFYLMYPAVRGDVIKTVAYFKEYRPSKNCSKSKIIKRRDIWKTYPVGFFDGACCRGKCGCGAYIVIEPGKHCHFWWEGGSWHK